MNFISKVFGRTSLKIKEEDMFWERENHSTVHNVPRLSDNNEPRKQISFNPQARSVMFLTETTNFSYQNPTYHEEQRNSQPSASSFFKNRAEVVRKSQIQQQASKGITYGRSVFDEYGHSHPSPSPYISSSNTHNFLPVENSEAVMRPTSMKELESRISRSIFAEEDTHARKSTSVKTDIFSDNRTSIRSVRQPSLQSSGLSTSHSTIMARPQMSTRTVSVVEKQEKFAVPPPVPKRISMRKPVTSDIKEMDALVDEDKKLTEELRLLEIRHSLLAKDPRNLTVAETAFGVLLNTYNEEITKYKSLANSRKLVLREIEEKRLKTQELHRKDFFGGDVMDIHEVKEKNRLIDEIEKIKGNVKGQKYYIDNFNELTVEKAIKFRENSERVMAQNVEMHFMDVRNSDEMLLKELENYAAKMI